MVICWRRKRFLLCTAQLQISVCCQYLGARFDMAVPSSSSSSVRFLQLELKRLQDEPVEGFRVRLLDDSNLFVWEVAIFGPPDTLYEGGYFKVFTYSVVPLFMFFVTSICVSYIN